MEKNQVTSGIKVIVIGGSAGSLDALLKILPGIKILKAALVMVVHRGNTNDTTLEELIALKVTLPVKEVEDKTRLERGYIYIAPPDYHLLFEKDHCLSLDTSEKVNYSRPSIDVAFESAADAYGSDVTAILLSGANTDGTKGLKAVKNAGGTIVVQLPDTAEMPFMPAHAIAHIVPDYILDTAGLTRFIQSEN